METTGPGGTLDDIRRLLGDLTRRIERLETASSAPLTTAVAHPAPAGVVPSPAPSAGDDIPEEIVLVIAAAVAAFCGERAHVRQIRLVSSHAWAQQGRVSVQASHRLQR